MSPTKPMSARQLSTLRYIDSHNFTTKTVRKCHQGTMWSLLYRGYLSVDRQNGDIRLSRVGREIRTNYEANTIPKRKYERDLTERCSNLLTVIRMRRISSPAISRSRERQAA